MKQSSLPEQEKYEVRDIDPDLLELERKKYRNQVKGSSKKKVYIKTNKPYPFVITVKFRFPSDVDAFAKNVGQSLHSDIKEFTYNPLNRKSQKHGFRSPKKSTRESNRSKEWVGLWKSARMPDFVQTEAKWECYRVKAIIKNIEDHQKFAGVVRQYLTTKSKSIYFPKWTPAKLRDKFWVSDLPLAEKNPRYPVFIISRGRSYSRYTAKALEELQVPYFIVVEPAEFEDYAFFIDPKKILSLPYNTDPENPTGPGRARNWCWDYAKKILKSERHWVMDDNITAFYRLHKNRRIKCGDGAMFRVCEQFVDRFTNVPVAGLQYRMFCAAKSEYPAFVANTRIYSCLLIDNACKRRWRGRYNEDTILSLDVLSDGDVTIQFNHFLQGKMGTQVLAGGNTDIFYHNEEMADFAKSTEDRYHSLGTLQKSVYLKQEYPTLTEVVWKFSRVHHSVNYQPFKQNQMLLKKNPKPVKDFQFRLVDMTEEDISLQQKQISDESELSPD